MPDKEENEAAQVVTAIERLKAAKSGANDLVARYNRLSAKDKEKLTLNEYILSSEVFEASEASGSSNYSPMALTLAATTFSNIRKSAIIWFKNLLLDDADCDRDGLLDLFGASLTPTEFDFWGYAKPNMLAASLDAMSVTSKASGTAAARVLHAKHAHFMMFQDGPNKLTCNRATFPNNLLMDGGSPSNDLDPRDIDKSFLLSLGLASDDGNAGELAELLKPHADRLFNAQASIYAVTKPYIKKAKDEPLAQAVFAHVLASLLNDLTKKEAALVPHVSNLMGMKAVETNIEICQQYLVEQWENKDENTRGDRPTEGQPHVLSVKGGLALSMLSKTSSPKSSPSATDLQNDFISGAYIIEIKSPLVQLKHGARAAKSQLLAESLARATLAHQFPLFSVLADCFCIHILVHTAEHQCYLTRREVAAGRMVAVLAWLHEIATSTDESRRAFLLRKFLGDFVSQEQYVDDREVGDRDPGPGSEGDQGGKKPPAKRRHEEMEAEEPWDSDDEEEEVQRQRMETYIAFENHKLLGWPLPLQEGVLRSFGLT